MTTKNAARWAINVLHSKSGNVLNSFRLLEPSITLFEGHARALTTTAQITTAAGRTQNRNRSVTPIIANLPIAVRIRPNVGEHRSICKLLLNAVGQRKSIAKAAAQLHHPPPSRKRSANWSAPWASGS